MFCQTCKVSYTSRTDYRDVHEALGHVVTAAKIERKPASRTIADIIRSRKGKAGAWRVEDAGTSGDGYAMFALYHYSTVMLVWSEHEFGPRLIDCSTGHGSVSDQNGMNTAFRVLSLPFYFSRKGGAEIVERSA